MEVKKFKGVLSLMIALAMIMSTVTVSFADETDDWRDTIVTTSYATGTSYPGVKITKNDDGSVTLGKEYTAEANGNGFYAAMPISDVGRAGRCQLVSFDVLLYDTYTDLGENGTDAEILKFGFDFDNIYSRNASVEIRPNNAARKFTYSGQNYIRGILTYDVGGMQAGPSHGAWSYWFEPIPVNAKNAETEKYINVKFLLNYETKQITAYQDNVQIGSYPMYNNYTPENNKVTDTSRITNFFFATDDNAALPIKVNTSKFVEGYSEDYIKFKNIEIDNDVTYEVSACNISDNQTDVDAGDITVEFNTPTDKTALLNAISVCDSQNSIVAGATKAVTMSADSKTAYISLGGLAVNSTYTLKIANTLKNTFDIALSNEFSRTFTTSAVSTIIAKDFLSTKPSTFPGSGAIVEYTAENGYHLSNKANLGLKLEDIDTSDNKTMIFEWDQKTPNYASINSAFGVPAFLLRKQGSTIGNYGYWECDARMGIYPKADGTEKIQVEQTISGTSSLLNPEYSKPGVSANSIYANAADWNHVKIAIDFDSDTITYLTANNEVLCRYQLEVDAVGFGNFYGKSVVWNDASDLYLKDLSVIRDYSSNTAQINGDVNSSGIIRIDFRNSVFVDGLKNTLKLYKNGTLASENPSVSVIDGTNGKSVNVSFGNLTQGESYVLKLDDYKDAYGKAWTTGSDISFTTAVDNLYITNGSYTKNGSLIVPSYAVKSAFTNSTNAVAIVAVYSKDNLGMLGFVKKDILFTQTDNNITFDSAIDIGSFEGEILVKGFVWDSLDNLVPYSNVKQLLIAE